MDRAVVVVGAGVTGVAVADELARLGREVVVVDRDVRAPRGSTAFAPGFVGLYNDAPVLTELARSSAAVYDGVGAGFARRGGLELATSEAGAQEVRRRVEAARAAGPPAEVVGVSELPAAVAEFVDTRAVVAAGWFPEDGVATPVQLTAAVRSRAESRGARFVAGEVVAVDPRDATGLVAVRTGEGEVLRAADLVLACGVWGPHLAAATGLHLPLVPVAHPYVYSAPRTDVRPGPFVRWPEHHVYARVHGDRLGIGSYDHAPVPVEQGDLGAGAGLPWRAEFTGVVTAAQRLLRPGARFEPEQRINGVFAMTPDNLPLLGRHPGAEGVWVAQALWVTHAAGAARLLADAVVGGAPLPPELAVDRFPPGAEAAVDLRRAALRLYRDIYANEAV